MSRPFEGVQHIVLNGGHWEVACHLVLDFGPGAYPLHFLQGLQREYLWPTAAHEHARKPQLQISLGFSRRGLGHAHVPGYVLACFALKSPAFTAGAALRASRHLGTVGPEAPECWDSRFAHAETDAVLSLHAMDKSQLLRAVRQIRRIGRAAHVRVRCLAIARRLHSGADGAAKPDEQWVHFGYRDGLTRVPVDGWPPHVPPDPCNPAHAAGEFVLGLPQDSGANPWLGGPGLRVWPEPLRAFFRHGSFGVLHQIEQHVEAFDAFVHEEVERWVADGIIVQIEEIRSTVKRQLETLESQGTFPDCAAIDALYRRVAKEYLKAKLCGRYPDGRPVGYPQAKPDDDFDYGSDGEGYGCPFGAHTRRMNPRGDGLAHSQRTRFLLRRGMPYGESPKRKRGLMGHFFCASIEDQYEHLLGQWADRVPLGSPDRGGARDPLIGAHAPGDGVYEIPRHGSLPLQLSGLRAFTRTRGVAYLFYPSLATLQGIANNSWWREPDEDDA